jgi:zinc transporter ZupT
MLWCVLAALGLPLGGFLAWGVVFETTMSAMARAITYSVTSGVLVGMCVMQLLTVCFNHKSESDSSRVTTTVLSGVLFMASLRMLLAFLYV